MTRQRFPFRPSSLSCGNDQTRSPAAWVVAAPWLIMLLVAPGASAQAPSFEGLGDLPGGGPLSYAWGVSADGSVVVGESDSAAGREAFMWQSGTMTGLGELPGGLFMSSALGVSADGTTIVGYSESGVSMGGYEAFVWRAGQMTPLGDLPGGLFWSFAFDVSADGQTIAGWSDSSLGSEGVVWQNGTMTGFGLLPGGCCTSAAFAISDDGTKIVGGAYGASSGEAYLWSDGVMTGLGAPAPYPHARAKGISSDGSFIIGTAGDSPVTEAFLYHNGTYTLLGFMPVGQGRTGAEDVSADGSTVVGWGKDTLNDSVAAIWTAEYGMRSVKDLLVSDFHLDLTGWSLYSAEGISDDGLVVVGLGINPNGDWEAWIARMVDCDDGNPVTVDFWNPALGACESLLIEDGRVIPIVVDRVTSGLMPRRLIDNVVRILIGTP